MGNFRLTCEYGHGKGGSDLRVRWAASNSPVNMGMGRVDLINGLDGQLLTHLRI